MSMPYRPDPTPPKATSPSWIRNIGTKPPSGVIESCMLLTAPVDVAVVTAANKRRRRDAEARLLALHVAAGLQFAALLVDAELRDQWIARLLARYRHEP